METQAKISAARLEAKIGSTTEAIVDEVFEGFVVARTKGDAPEVDGVIEIEGCPSDTAAGDIVRAKINGATEHDLTGQFIT